MAEIRLDQEKEPRTGKRGGARPGAGRPLGKHLHHALTAKSLTLTAKSLATTDPGHDRRAVREAIAGSKLDPLLILLSIASRSRDEKLRVEAAGIACRYTYPALSAASIQTEHRTVDASHAMAALHSQLDRLAPPATIEAEPVVAEATEAPQASEPAAAPQPPAEATDAAQPEPSPRRLPSSNRPARKRVARAARPTCLARATRWCGSTPKAVSITSRANAGSAIRSRANTIDVRARRRCRRRSPDPQRAVGAWRSAVRCTPP